MIVFWLLLNFGMGQPAQGVPLGKYWSQAECSAALKPGNSLNYSLCIPDTVSVWTRRDTAWLDR